MRGPPGWVAWTWRTAVGELIGLGASLSMMAVPLWWVEEPYGVAEVASILAVAAAGGVVEGTVLALFQAPVLTWRWPGFSRGAYVAVTAGSAALCWALGMTPSIVLSGGADGGGDGAGFEPPVAVVLALAAGLGAVLGVVLSLGPAWVVRRAGGAAGRWVGAHSAAWAVGMIWVFAVMGRTTLDMAWWQTGLLVALAAGGAGLLVGAISGLALGGTPPGATRSG